MANTMKVPTETVKLSQCSVGDVIVSDGGRWRLVALNADYRNGVNGFRSFRSEFLEVVGTIYNVDTKEERPHCAVPEGWRKDWTIQSNDYHAWLREVPAPVAGEGR